MANYGRCQDRTSCQNPATHQVKFRLQPNPPMKVCSECVRKHRKPGNDITELN